MRISDGSSDVCSSDLLSRAGGHRLRNPRTAARRAALGGAVAADGRQPVRLPARAQADAGGDRKRAEVGRGAVVAQPSATAGTISFSPLRSEEHTSELQSLMRISYAVFCLKKKKNIQ